MFPIKKRLFSKKKHYRASFNAALGQNNPPETDKEPEGSLNIKNNWDLTPINRINLQALAEHAA
jgi:hypothetical protein